MEPRSHKIKSDTGGRKGMFFFVFVFFTEICYCLLVKLAN